MKKSFLPRLVAYLRRAKTAAVPFDAYAIQELGTGIAAVADDYGSQGEIDVYFDAELWGSVDPTLWGDGLYPPALERTGLGVLSGVSRVPRVSTFGEAQVFARGQLKPRGEAQWLSPPAPPQPLTDETLAELASR